MDEIRIVDIVNEDSFGLAPPCTDPGFDHRTCDYWEDADRGSKAARLSWLRPASEIAAGRPSRPRNPFGDDEPEPAANPFAPTRSSSSAANPFLRGDGNPLADNPFAPSRPTRPTVGSDVPRKLALLGRGLAVSGSYAKVMRAGDRSVGYVQFGPLSAYPRALRLRELYPQLPDAPLPAVITCIATTGEARAHGYARRLVEATCADLAARGFAAVEAYPEVGARTDATSAATPAFWIEVGFTLAVDDPRFPVLRRELE